MGICQNKKFSVSKAWREKSNNNGKGLRSVWFLEYTKNSYGNNKKTNPMKEWAGPLNDIFPQGNTDGWHSPEKADQHYYKTVARCHSVAIQLCALPNGKWQVLVKTWRSVGDDHTLLVRMWNGAAIFENSVTPSREMWKSPSDPILEFHSEIDVLKSWKRLPCRSLAWLLRVELLTVTRE